jgi:hypothetical protein
MAAASFLQERMMRERTRSLSRGAWVRAAMPPILLLVSTGCIVPFPHVKKTWDPIAGRVLDSNAAPLRGATVFVHYPDGDEWKAVTADDGSYRFGAKHRFEWWVMLAPYDPIYLTVLQFHAPGFQARRLALPRYAHKYQQFDSGPDDWPDTPSESGAWELPDVQLTPGTDTQDQSRVHEHTQTKQCIDTGRSRA